MSPAHNPTFLPNSVENENPISARQNLHENHPCQGGGKRLGGKAPGKLAAKVLVKERVAASIKSRGKG